MPLCEQAYLQGKTDHQGNPSTMGYLLEGCTPEETCRILVSRLTYKVPSHLTVEETESL